MWGSWRALLIPALVLLAVGCATKGYVREVIGQSETKFDAQLGEHGKRLAAQTERTDAQAAQLESVSGWVGKVETSVDAVGGIARGAATKADAAAARAEEVDGRLSRFLGNRGKREVVDTIDVHFGLDQADLSDAAQTALTELITELAADPSLVVDLSGYTDSLGAPQYNLQLSERRVAAVRRFLVQRGVDLSRINWIGMGHLPDNGSKADRAKNRRVTVRLLLPADATATRQASARETSATAGTGPAPTSGAVSGR
jgi:outer membrane protein OmpA-like peptidoglycan-associated protein